MNEKILDINQYIVSRYILLHMRNWIFNIDISLLCQYQMSRPVPGIEKYAPSDSGASEASDILDLRDDEGWEDAEPEEEEQNQFISLLDDEVFSDISAMLEHCKEKYELDFLKIRQNLGLDFYGSIKLTNYLRSKTQSGEKPSESISKADLEDEKYLKPVLEDDAFLFSLDDLPDIVEQSSGSGKGREVESGPLVTRVSELEEELRRTQSQFENYRNAVNATLDERWNKPAGPAATKEEGKRDDDSQYFTSYSYNGQKPTHFIHPSSNTLQISTRRC